MGAADGVSSVKADFRTQVIEHAKLAVSRANRVVNEEGAKQYLVLPFFKLLGYDPLDPDEIIPESQASFADKFKHRVDYAICHEGVPVIGVECKRTGALTDGHRGELKGYFNAVSTTKLGILTDGLIFELYTDTDAENMMDDDPFITLNLTSIAKGELDDNALDALARLRKGEFDPADVGADARRRLFISRYIEVLESTFRQPGEDFTKAIMDIAGIEGRRTTRLLDEHMPIVRDAIGLFMDKLILERVGFARRQDLVRVAQGGQPAAVVPATNTNDENQPSASAPDDGIITTETEMMIFDHVKNRLAFLVNDEAHYDAVQEITYRDYKTMFLVFYKQERRGRILSFREGPNGEYRFDFPDGEGTIEVTDLQSVDTQLLASFLKCVEELGAGA